MMFLILLGIGWFLIFCLTRIGLGGLSRLPGFRGFGADFFLS